METDGTFTVIFQRSGLSAKWTDSMKSLLDLADALCVDINSGCRFGDCGTCMTRLISGQVSYEYPTGAVPDPGFCLPCCSKPITSIVLDA